MPTTRFGHGAAPCGTACRLIESHTLALTAPEVISCVSEGAPLAMDGKDIRVAFRQTENGRRMMVAAVEYGTARWLLGRRADYVVTAVKKNQETILDDLKAIDFSDAP